MTTISALTIQDILLFGSNKCNVKMDRDTILPFIILPMLLLLCTLSRAITIVVMVIIGMGVLYVYSRPRQKNRSPFFFSWTISSGLYLFLIFEIYVLGTFEITQIENFIFLVLLAGTCYCFYKTKTIADFELAMGSSKGKEYSPVLTSDSLYCQICQIEVNERFFHSIWWDCCIVRANYCYFLTGQVFAFATFLVGTNFGLTVVCQPFIFYGAILMPEDCENVYFEVETAICFVACVYGIGYLLVIALVLLHQILVYIPKYTAPQWKKLVNVLNV